MNTHHPILIVGAGPVGMTLACLLNKQGIHATLIDKRDKPSTITRGVGLSFSSLAVLNKVGVLEQVLQQAEVNQNISVFFKAKHLFDINHQDYPQSIPGFVRLEQTKVEALLCQQLHNLGGAVVRQCELIDIKDTQNHYIVKVNHKGIEQEWTADYVIGCDGTHSCVKSQMHIDEDFQDYQLFFTVADCVFDNLAIENDQYFIGESGYLMLVKLPCNTVRVIFTDKAAVELETVNCAYIEKTIYQYLATHRKINSIEWKTTANFYHRIAKRAVANNLVLAGDALHGFSPVGGMNMNMGLLDAESLACKLPQAIQNAHACALELYNQERLQACEQLKNNTFVATQLMANLTDNMPLLNQVQHELKGQSIIGKIASILSGCDLTYQNDHQPLSRTPFLRLGQPWSGHHQLFIFIQTLTLRCIEKVNQLIHLYEKQNSIDISIFTRHFELSNSFENIAVVVADEPFEIFDIDEDQYLFLRPDDYLVEKGLLKQVNQ